MKKKSSMNYLFCRCVLWHQFTKVLKKNGIFILLHFFFQVSYARPSSEAIKGANLYVSGLPKHMTQPDLERLFSCCGNIITSRILCDNITGEFLISSRLNHPFTHDHSWVPKWVDRHITLAIILFFYFTGQGLSKGVGFIRFDQRVEAERAIQKLNGTIPEGATEPITVKFANNPSNNAKAIPPLAAYLAPQAARRAFGGALHPAGRFRYVISW